MNGYESKARSPGCWVLWAVAVCSSGLAASAFAAIPGVRFAGTGMNQTSKPQLNSLQQAAMDAYKGYCDSNGADRERLENQLLRMELEARRQLGDAGMGVVTDAFPAAQEAVDDMLNQLDGSCDDDNDNDEPVVSTFGIIYSRCRMYMNTDTQLLDIKIPDSGADGHMLAISDAGGVRTNLKRSAELLAENATGKGWSSDVNWTDGPGDTKVIIEYPATYYAYEYTMGLGAGMGAALGLSQAADQEQLSASQYLQGAGAAGINPMEMIAGMISVTNSGSGYFSTAVPGMDIVQEFYTNFADNVAPGGDLGSMMGGMINNIVGLLEKGVPLEISSTVRSKIMGRTTVSGSSSSQISGVQLISLPDNWCEAEYVPPGVEITDVDQQLAGVMNQAPQQPGESAAGASAGNAAAPSSGGGGQIGCPDRPSSEELYSDDLTQWIQRMLEALGYDPGNTDGDATVETTIAISQFEAEHGLSVAGEATPQIAGIIAAELDAC